MILAIYIYLSILFFLPLCGTLTWANRNKSLVACLIIGLISILVGLRYNVGTDWDNYVEYYEYVGTLGIDWLFDTDMEPLYFCLNWFLNSLALPYHFLFMLIMALHLGLLYKSLSNYRFLLSLGLFLYVTFLFTTSLNIQRQTLSFCIFFFSLRYLLRGESLKYYVCILFAIGFHYSSIVLLFAYFLRFNIFRFLNNRLIVLCLYILSFFVFNYLLDFIYFFFEMFISNDKYIRNLSALGNANMDVSSGLGILLYYIIDLVLIVFSSKLSIIYKKYGYEILFRIFVCGILLSNIFGVDVFLSRVPFALENLRFLLLSFLLYYLLYSRVLFNRLLAYFLLIISVGMYIVGILHGNSGCSPFQFGC